MISEEVKRIQNAKEDISAAIVEKGGVAPTGTLDTYGDAVRALPSGGGDDFKITNGQYFFYNGNRLDILVNDSNKLAFEGACNAVFASNSNNTNSYKYSLNINNVDFSKVTNLYEFMKNTQFLYLPNELIIDAPLNVNMEYAFYGYPLCCDDMYVDGGTCSIVKKVTIKNSSKVSNWTQCFYTGFNNINNRYNKRIEEIEWDMSGATTCNYVFCMSLNTYSGCKFLKKIIFNGSFGGNTSTSSLTLELDKLESMTKDSYIEMFNSLSINKNKKTRTFVINETIYDTMTEDELAIAEDKGYTVTC